MTSVFEFDGHKVEIFQDVDLLDVTSLHRVDPAWRFVDAQGHEHRWHDEHGYEAKDYSPSAHYHVPTVLKVDDEPEYAEDGEEIPVWHYECRECRQVVDPGYTADTSRQFIPGMKRETILVDGLRVTREELQKLRVGLLSWPPA